MDSHLDPGVIYHIYNRGNNREDLFCEERNYSYFLSLYTEHIAPWVDTFAYCLLRNHFHLLIRLKDFPCSENPSRRFSNFFNAYAKAYNHAYGRVGALFQRPFKRVAVTRDSQFIALVAYIHINPEKHGFVDDFRNWPHSSYPAMLSSRPTRLSRTEVMTWFGGPRGFVEYHEQHLHVQLTRQDLDLTGF